MDLNLKFLLISTEGLVVVLLASDFSAIAQEGVHLIKHPIN